MEFLDKVSVFLSDGKNIALVIVFVLGIITNSLLMKKVDEQEGRSPEQ